MDKSKIEKTSDPVLYQDVQSQKQSAFRFHLKEKTLSPEEFQSIITGLKIRLNCGHYATIGHQFSNTFIIYSYGGGEIKTKCHDCGY